MLNYNQQTMFVVAKKKTENRWQVQVVESVRQGKSVLQKIVRNVGTAYSEKELTEFKKIGEAAVISIQNARKPVLFDPEDFYAPRKRGKPVGEEQARVKDLREEKRIVEGITDIFGKIYDELGFEKIISNSNKNEDWNAILKAMVLARLAAPQSKLASAQFVSDFFDIKIPVHKIYRMLDLLADENERVLNTVANHTRSLFQEKVDVLFFDVTTLYFESIVRDELKNFGFSKDCKFNQSQVTLALVTTQDGMPITYKLFPGNTYEGHTLLEVAKTLKSQFNIADMVLVADRAMFTKDNLKLMDELGMHYVIAAKLRTLPKNKQKEILSSQLFKPSCISDELHWTNEFSHEGRRLIVSYSSKRAAKDASDRNRNLERLAKRTDKNGNIPQAKLLNNNGTKKFLTLGKNEAKIDEIKIRHDQEWDGLHGIITNQDEASAAQLLERYRGLWQIEEAFRVNKHSLKMRPIYHWSPRRIQAHISLCYLAYAVAKHANYQLKKNNVKMSLEEMRRHLLAVQASIIRDVSTQKRYVIPSCQSKEQAILYDSFNLQRDLKPYAL